MSDRTPGANPAGGLGWVTDLARKVKDLERRLDDMDKKADSPTKGFIWVPGAGGSELWVKSTVTGSQEKVAGPL